MRKLGHTVKGPSPRLHEAGFPVWAQVFSGVMLVPLHVVSVKMLGNGPPSERVSMLDGGGE